MRLALLIILALAGPARAEDGWIWEVAARAFEKAGNDKAAAHAAVLAWRNAVANEGNVTGMTPRARGLLDAIAVYIPLAPRSEVVNLLFMRATVLVRRDLLDDAIPILETIVMAHPSSEVAEYAAPLLLDALNRQQDFERLVAWATKMRAMPALLAKRPDLSDIVERIHTQGLRRQAETAEANGEFRACARLFRDVAKIASRDRAESLYNAAHCFERAGDTVIAKQLFTQVARMKTSLAAKAKERADRL